jgi:hypothetical protein
VINEIKPVLTEGESRNRLMRLVASDTVRTFDTRADDPRALSQQVELLLVRAQEWLPDDSEYKITRADVIALRSEARFVGSGGLESEYEDEEYLTMGQREERLRTIAAKLAALLPPEM